MFPSAVYAFMLDDTRVSPQLLRSRDADLPQGINRVRYLRPVVCVYKYDADALDLLIDTVMFTP